ncbi:MAG: glycosyltransferase family protein [Lachnospiraceae bacterium]|nr:glycosyltransferase family protein [Lachnospiraceae bacterium]
MTVDENKICFIICVNNQLFYEECVRYLQCLSIPEGMQVEILAVEEAVSMAAGYNEGMNSSNAKYKIYMHQDVFIINRYFIHDIISIFCSDTTIGMIGMVGNVSIPENGVMWSGERVKYGNEDITWKTYRYNITDGMWDVACIDGLLMATQYDVSWREDLFDGWDFYDISQSCEMRKKGYRIVVPMQNCSWYLHDDKPILQLWNYNKYRKIFMENYM